MFLSLDGLTQTVGIPFHWNHTNLLTDAAGKLITSYDSIDESLHYSRAIRIASSDTSQIIKDVFSRIGLARASQEAIEIWANRIIKAVEYWRMKRSNGSQQEKNHALDRIRVLIEVLARTSIRLPLEKAKELFRLALELGREQTLQHFWLFEVLDHLLTYSQQSIPESQQAEFLYDALAFPLIAEVNNNALEHIANRWPNPVIKHPTTRVNNASLDRRVNELIEHVSSGSSSCTPALLRLLPLVENNFLTKVELNLLAVKIWGNVADYTQLPKVGLYPHALCHLPTEDKGAVRLLVENSLFEAEDDLLLTAQHLLGIAAAATDNAIKIIPNPEQAAKYFDLLVQWRPMDQEDDPFGSISQQREHLIDGIGKALSYAIVPALASDGITLKRFESLFAFYEAVNAPSIIIALVHFAGLSSEIENKIEKLVRKELQGKIPNEVSFAAQALLEWKKLAELGVVSQPKALIQRLVYLIESERFTGLQALLYVIKKMFKKNWLSQDEIITLIETLPSLFNATDYYNINPTSRVAVSASSIREACVKLAKNISDSTGNDNLKLLEILEAAKVDALPEVRFAANGW